ncbi:unnamed protein product [Tetraodon nigroviridis]|uniref:(spotted green pufferfish) hypothetical protein n=1 Tax=Tetraodon nigroviridis TaxID=99883 RepID=Q4S6W6_TETNG|nr:unnamed protein product [Tetraodon nigroviridis]
MPVTLTNLPIFKLKESCVQRRYSDFEWLRAEWRGKARWSSHLFQEKLCYGSFPFEATMEYLMKISSRSGDKAWSSFSIKWPVIL